MALTPLHLSGSTKGEPIEITATGTPGDLVHTATNVAGALDEIYLYVSGAATAEVAVEFGSTDAIVVVAELQDKGLYQILPGLRLGDGAEVRVYADASVFVTGWVNRMEP